MLAACDEAAVGAVRTGLRTAAGGSGLGASQEAAAGLRQRAGGREVALRLDVGVGRAMSRGRGLPLHRG